LIQPIGEHDVFQPIVTADGHITRNFATVGDDRLD
jgi:hypothetical protein